jgi:signal transduction histidine kinase
LKKPAGLHALSPTAPLVLGLIVTLATVVAYSWYVSGEISGLRRLQADLTDRNRMASLQLLRIQSDLNQLALATRDMSAEPDTAPLASWQGQFDRIRRDLEDALRREEQVSVVVRSETQSRELNEAVSRVWATADRVFALARAGRHGDARAEIRAGLQARLAELSTAVGRLLLQNNQTEARAAQQAQDIYQNVQRQVYWFLSAALFAIAATSLYLIYSNQQLFARLALLAEQRRELARTLIATRESTLREIARELHDDFGQLLTAIGAMLRRAETRAPDTSPLRDDLREIRQVAQSALDNVRGLSQTLHPTVLDELGLESTIEWYLSTVERQLGVRASYARAGRSRPVRGEVAVHTYRVLQEAINNVARHSGASTARVTLRFDEEALELEVADNGRGMHPEGRRGLGLVAMRERAELLGGSVQFLEPEGGGTLVRLRVPLQDAVAPDTSAAIPA